MSEIPVPGRSSVAPPSPSDGFTVSVLVPSFNRPTHLRNCLQALALQTRPPEEVFVVWQADDAATREAANEFEPLFLERLKILHLETRGIVPAENLALSHAQGRIIAMIDDDAVAPVDWLEKHLACYADPTVGGVGGPARNHTPDGARFPLHGVEPMLRLAWYGKLFGNAYDHPDDWRSRPIVEVDHLVGYNMSLRRSAFGRYESALKEYWQMFELEVCLQVRSKGLRMLFDYSNVVDHFPTNRAFDGRREGDLAVKIFHPAYNQAYILAKYTQGCLRLVRLGWMLLVGTSNTPGLAAFFVMAARRPRRTLDEWRILRSTLQAVRQGWNAGSAARREGGET